MIKEIEDLYAPVIDILEESFLKNSRNDYKGFITANSSFVTNPRILFIGINPGDGAYNELNKKNKLDAAVYPKRLFADRSINKLDWLKDGNARGEFVEKKWFSYKWYQTQRKVNNVFVKRMVDFLFSYYEINDESDFRFLEEKIESEIFYWNRYPIATKSTIELKSILRQITKRKPTLNGKEIRELGELKNFFRQRTIDSIHKVSPRTIICLGRQSFRDLTNNSIKIEKDNPTKEYQVKLRKDDDEKYPVYVISREGNWQERVRQLGSYLRQCN